MKNKMLLLCSILSLSLCFAQISGNRMLILLCLGAFLSLICYASAQHYELPVLLFFLPWTALLRLSPDSISFYTLALLLVGVLSVIRNRFYMKSYYVGITLLLVVITLLSKLISGYKPANSYIMFIAMLALYPMVDVEERKYNFGDLNIFFSFGIVIAALTAQQFAGYPNIAKYIVVDSYLTITRRCGFYGDPNFYTAQITAAIAGCMLLISDDRKDRSAVVLFVLLGLLVYCGFMSGSKSFALITVLLVVFWIAEILVMRGKITKKAALLVSLCALAAYVFTSSLFQEQLNVILTRFSWADNAAEFTTGRTELWSYYLTEILNDLKLLLLGQGFTNVMIYSRASHNTVIQLLYQFGILGSVLLIAWFIGYYYEIVGAWRIRNPKMTRIFMILAGTFLPWLAIDILFFDEVFLLSTYAYLGIRELAAEQKEVTITEEGKHRE